MTRALEMVGTVRLTSRGAQFTPSSLSRARSVSAWVSQPTRPMIEMCFVNGATLRATLAAPPGYQVSWLTSTTGTGASGEMRRTLPQMK